MWSALEDLGETEGEVIATLKARGYKGFKGEPSSCPVANYLYGETNVSVLIDTDGCVLPDIEDMPTFDTPSAVAKFIHEFDHGAYPELEE